MLTRERVDEISTQCGLLVRLPGESIERIYSDLLYAFALSIERECARPAAEGTEGCPICGEHPGHAMCSSRSHRAHCNAFARAIEGEADARNKLEGALTGPLELGRDVSITVTPEGGVRVMRDIAIPQLPKRTSHD